MTSVSRSISIKPNNVLTPPTRNAAECRASVVRHIISNITQPPCESLSRVKTVQIGNHETLGTVDAVLFDFGTISLTYSIPLSGPLSSLLNLSDELWDNAWLLSAARKVVAQLQAALTPAITKPNLSELVEDYAIFQINRTAAGESPEEIIRHHSLPLAQILRAEPETLSQQEIRDALSCRMSYGIKDGVLIDWNAALIFDRDAEDVRTVLEFANVELLALRCLDDQLDNDLDEAYETVTRRRFAAAGLSRLARARPATDRGFADGQCPALRRS